MANFEKYLDEARNKSVTLDSKQVKKIMNYIEDVITDIETESADGGDVSMLNQVLEILERG